MDQKNIPSSFLFYFQNSSFWKACPVLWYALFFLLGVGWKISSEMTLFVPLFLLLLVPFFPYFQQYRKVHVNLFCRIRLFSACVVFLFGIFYTQYIYQFPPLENRGGGSSAISGMAILCIDSSILYRSSFSTSWKCRGRLQRMESIPEEGKESHCIAQNLPISLYLSFEEKELSLDRYYRVYGKLEKRGHTWFFHSEKKASWLEGEKRFFSLASWRQKAKQVIHHLLKREGSEKDPRMARFFQGIFTGEFSDRNMTIELGRVGLQHVMAISGFHFSLIALFLSFCLRFFFSPRLFTSLLMVFLTLYYVFIGPSPSVQRAWIMQLLALGALFFEREVSSWNLLGIALFFVLLYEPLFAMQIGFQFSFLVTAAILLFTPSIDRWFSNFWPTRTLSSLIERNLWEQHGYLLLILCRKALALTLSAHFVSIPLALYHFHAFPLLSLFYSIAFPFFVSLCMLLFFLSLPFLSLSSLPFSFVEKLMQISLDFVYHTPLTFHWTLYTESISSHFLILLFSFSFFFYMIRTSQKKRENISFVI